MSGILDSNFNSFIMKLVDDFLTKVGTDKVLHHVVGALICAIFSIVFIIQDAIFDWTAVAVPLIGSIVVLFLSIIKEYVDDKPDWMDVIWAMVGCLWVFAAVALGVLFNQFSS